MAKLGVTIPADMDAALEKVAKQRGAPVSSLVREAIRDWLSKQGIEVSGEVSWGGDRRSESTDNE